MNICVSFLGYWKTYSSHNNFFSGFTLLFVIKLKLLPANVSGTTLKLTLCYYNLLLKFI